MSINNYYSGLTLGRYIVYNVDSIYYNIPFNIDTTFHFQIKEVVDSKYTDLEGDEAYKIIRYKKEINSTYWNLTDVWNAKITNTTYQKDEENNRYIKMIFPISLNKKWNGNSLNNSGKMDYEYIAVNQPETVGVLALDSVTTVLQFEDINLVTEKSFSEKFATNIGLVYKKSKDVTNVYNNNTGFFEHNTGADVTMTISSYGTSN